MRLIDADELKNRNVNFAIVYGGEIAKAIMDGFNDVIDHTPSFDLEKHDAEIQAEAIRKFAEWLEENVIIDVENGVTVVEEVEYTRVISFMELLAMYVKEQK